MAVPLVLGFQRVADADAAQAVLTQYTHGCGYVRAWLDPADPLYVWLQPACPADALIALLVAAIVGMVTNQITNSANITDPYDRIQSVITGSHTDAANWIHNNTYQHLEQFLLNDPTRLRGFILAEMQTQGIIG